MRKVKKKQLRKNNFYKGLVNILPAKTLNL